MKVLVTGAKGFIGKNLIAALGQLADVEVFSFDVDTSMELLEEYCSRCDFVYNLAGVNRPKDEKEFMTGNMGFASELLAMLKKARNTCPVMDSSSIQAAYQNPYGESKKAGEELFLEYGRECHADVCIYRFPNVFGKWCRPNYNSVVATFCHNIAREMPIRVNDRSTRLRLVYIDDVVEELLRALEGKAHRDDNGYCYVPVEYQVTLGEIADLLYGFYDSRKSLMVPNMEEGSFEKKLYAAYLSYLPADRFAYPLLMHTDERGSFTEILKSADRGQVSVNITKPGIKKGEHWHHTKNEKFLVVSGKALLRFRRHGESEITEYHVSGNKLEVVDIPPGYTHSIINEGDTDLVTLIWCSECFYPDKPDDTIYETVDRQQEQDR